ELLAITSGVEGVRTRSYGTNANSAHAANNTADSEKLVEVSAELRRTDLHRVVPSKRELHSILAEVIADGNLAAVGISPARKPKLIEVIRTGLNEKRYVELRQADRIRNSLFITKVGQAYEDAFNFLAVGTKELSAFHSVGPGFHCP